MARPIFALSVLHALERVALLSNKSNGKHCPCQIDGTSLRISDSGIKARPTRGCFIALARLSTRWTPRQTRVPEILFAAGSEWGCQAPQICRTTKAASPPPGLISLSHGTCWEKKRHQL